MSKNFVCTLAVAASLGGCSYVHSYFTQNDYADATAFCEQRRADPAIRPVAGKLPIVNTDEITPEMLTLDGIPTDAELDAIKALSHNQSACRQRVRAVTRHYEPTQLATRDELDMKLDLVTADLLQRKMSYGNANRLYRQAALEASNRLTEQAKDELADAEEREAATWRSLGQSIAGAAKPPAPRSEKTCSWVDSSVDCGRH